MRTIGAERQESEVAVIVGVDTHLDFHVAVAGGRPMREASTHNLQPETRVSALR